MGERELLFLAWVRLGWVGLGSSDGLWFIVFVCESAYSDDDEDMIVSSLYINFSLQFSGIGACFPSCALGENPIEEEKCRGNNRFSGNRTSKSSTNQVK